MRLSTNFPYKIKHTAAPIESVILFGNFMLPFLLLLVCIRVSTACEDKVNAVTGKSDCANMKSFCTNADYKAIMTDQCPKTCGFCGKRCCSLNWLLHLIYSNFFVLRDEVLPWYHLMNIIYCYLL